MTANKTPYSTKPDCGHLDWCCNDSGQIDACRLSLLNEGTLRYTHPATVPPHLVSQLEQATWAMDAILSVLAVDDDDALSLGNRITDGLHTAVRTIHRDSLTSAMEQITAASNKAAQAAKAGGAA